MTKLAWQVARAERCPRARPAQLDRLDDRDVGAVPRPARRAVPRGADRHPRTRRVAACRPPARSTTIEDLGNDVLAVLDELGADRVHLAGLSLGAMTGMWLAIHHPERIPRLALLCTSAYLPPEQAWLDRAETVRRDGMAAIADERVRFWVTPQLAESNPALMARLRAMIISVDAESYAQCCEAIAGDGSTG